MSANPCQNQGYVLDGFPQITKEAKELFNMTDIDEELVEEEEGGDELTSYNKKIMPEFVISLCAPDDLLYSHVMDLPEREVQGTIYTEENMVKRVAKFRANNTDDATVLNYFDELEIHPLLIDTESDKSPLMESTFMIITNKIGKPRNFADGDEDEYAEQARLLSQEKENDEIKRRNEIERKAFEEQQAKMEEWANLLDALKEEEEELLAIQGIPVRHYLMRYIFPVLTRGLLEVARVRPDDPVDYLAEYLFRENPEGKMFNPDYAQAGEELASLALLFQDSLIKTDSLLDTKFVYSHSQEMDQVKMGSYGVSRDTSKGKLVFEESGSQQSVQIREKTSNEKMNAERVDCFTHEADLDETPLTPVDEEIELEDKSEDKLNDESDIINNIIDLIEENSDLELIEEQ